MTSPFEAPSSDAPAVHVDLPPLAAPTEDPHVVVTIVLLMMYGIPLTLIALLFPVGGVVGGYLDPDFGGIGGAAAMGCVGTVEGVCIGLMGMLYASSGIGLIMGRKWAWILGLCAAALWLSSPCCLPFGGYCLFALLRERVRRAYGIM